jgi:hypothetical protein
MYHDNNTGLPEVSDKEWMDTVSFWRQHVKNLRKTSLVSDEAISWVVSCTRPECIGFNSTEGELIRSGEIGKWDMFQMAREGGFSTQESLLMADLTPSQLAQEEHRESLKDAGFDPDDPDEMAEFQRLENMTPDELEAEIVRLRELLAIQD